MAKSPGLTPELRDDLVAILREHISSTERLAIDPDRPNHPPPALEYVTHLLEHVELLRMSGVDSPPSKRSMLRALCALQRRAKAAANANRTPHGPARALLLNHSERSGWATLDLLRTFEAPAEEIARMASEAAASLADGTAGIRHGAYRVIPREVVEGLARMWEDETGKPPGFSNTIAVDRRPQNLPFVRFASAVLEHAGVHADAVSLLREIAERRPAGGEK